MPLLRLGMLTLSSLWMISSALLIPRVDIVLLYEAMLSSRVSVFLLLAIIRPLYTDIVPLSRACFARITYDRSRYRTGNIMSNTNDAC